jgi:hypothetical protein
LQTCSSDQQISFCACIHSVLFCERAPLWQCRCLACDMQRGNVAMQQPASKCTHSRRNKHGLAHLYLRNVVPAYVLCAACLHVMH